MTELIWSPQALRDIESIRTYIAEDSPHYAELVVGRIMKAVERLRTFPESGRMVPERNDPKIREVIARPYRVVYRTGDDDAFALERFHQRLQPPRHREHRDKKKKSSSVSSVARWLSSVNLLQNLIRALDQQLLGEAAA